MKNSFLFLILLIVCANSLWGEDINDTIGVTACDSYQWDDTVILQSGEYQRVNNTDTSFLILTIKHSTHYGTSASACDSFRWHNMQCDTTGVYVYSYENSDGCPSADTLHLVVLHSTHHSAFDTVCETKTWQNNVYTASGTYTYPYTNDDNCSSVDTLHLVVNPGYHSERDIQTCCENYYWGDTLRTVTGDYRHTFTTAKGCDSTVSLTLVVNHTTQGTDYRTACDSLRWMDNNTYFTSNFTATHILTNHAGCDSVVTLNLTLNHATHDTVMREVCDYADWNGNRYSHSGVFVHPYMNSQACPSADTLYLSIHYNSSSSVSVSECDSYRWHDTLRNSTNTYLYHYNTIDGCPSVDTLHLTIRLSDSVTDGHVACDSFRWIDGVEYYQSDSMATHVLTNRAGCDSVVTLNLLMGNTSYTERDTTVCDSYIWQGQQLALSGLYVDTIYDVAHCPQMDALRLTIHYSNTGIDSREVCDSLVWIDNNTYREDNQDATFTLLNANQCDSVITLNLYVHHASISSERIEECESFDWNGQTLVEGGNYSDTLIQGNRFGCDSVLNLSLAIHHDILIKKWNDVLTINVDKIEDAIYEWHHVTADGDMVSQSSNKAYLQQPGGLWGDYYLVILSPTHDTIDYSCLFVTGNANNASSIPSVTPNPTRGQTSIQWGNWKIGDRGYLLNMQGQHMREIVVQQDGIVSVDLNGLCQGVYFLQIADETVKIVKQ